MKKYIDPCEKCVFYDKDGYGIEDEGYNSYCRHATFYKCKSQCPTVQSFHIRCNLGLEKRYEEVEDRKPH